MPNIQSPRYHLPILVAVLFFFYSPIPGFSETIEGFRDLKFGMTEEEVNNLEACSSSVECLYNLSGKNRYLSLEYRPGSDLSNNLGASPTKEALPTLARITIDMGRFSDEWYGQLQMMLSAQYTMTHNLNERAISAFNSEQASELILGYENEMVLLKVMRRVFGNLVLKVIYQTQSLADETRKNLSPGDL